VAEIRTYVMPPKLYRYRSVDGPERLAQEMAAMEEGYLWCSSFRDMNDPMEGIYQAAATFKSDPDFENRLKDILGRKLGIGICSLSETATNELMWAHYADQFRGVCVEYDVAALLAALPREVDLVQVHYNDKMLKIGFEELRDADVEDIAKRILSCKYRSWNYEREWRVLGRRQRRLGYRDRRCVTRVFAGDRMAEGVRERIGRRLEDLGVPLSPMRVRGYALHA
jgi:hypothetical protein